METQEMHFDFRSLRRLKIVGGKRLTRLECYRVKKDLPCVTSTVEHCNHYLGVILLVRSRLLTPQGCELF